MPSLNTGNAILSNAIAVNSSYNVGIGGAASGSFKLQVTGTSNLTGALTGTSASFSSSVTATTGTTGAAIKLTGVTNYGFIEDANAVRRIWFENTGDYRTILDLPASGTAFQFRNSSGSILTTITSGGNVGIGTSNPTPRDAGALVLELYGTSSGRSSLKFTNSTSGTGATDGMWMGYDNGLNFTMVNNEAGYIALATSNAERMRITSGGLFKFQNNGSSYENNSGGVNEIATAANDTNVLFRNTASSLTNPRAGVDVFYSAAAPNSTTACFYQGADNAAGRTLRFEVRSNGGIGNYTTNNIPLSDIRLKKDITLLESVWDKIKNIEIVKYKFKDQTHDDFNMGVIAQQVEEVAPELVDPEGWNTLAEDGTTYKGIWETDLNYYSIKALQEAMARIEDQQAQIDEQQKQINSLINR
jgi:hypothetical protein